MPIRLLLSAIALCALAAHAAPLVKTEHVEAELVTDRLAAEPGKPFVVGLKLRMEMGWHTYWKNPGDSGLPTRIHWILPPGWKAGEIHWPFPQLLPVGPLMNYGYEDDVVLLTELTPPADAKSGDVPVKAKAEWLVCKDICVPEKGEVDTTIAVKPGEAALQPRWQAHIERARSMLPVEPAGWKYEAAIQGKSLVVRLTAPEGQSPPAKATFFPESENLIEPAAPEKLARQGRTLQVEMKLADPPPSGVTEVKGVAVSESGWPGSGGRKAIEVAAPVRASLAAIGSTSSSSSGGASASLLAALFFAIVGGALLNLMPCVFPVLGIKVMGFVQHAHGDARAMRIQGVVYSVGVLASFIALAAIMLALRAGGTQLGWGFQLQSPVVVVLLATLFMVLALNLSGVFEWGAFAQSLTSGLSAKGRYADAFLSGVLASVVATPCTAPFMGAAVGYTLTQDASLAIAVFAMLGIGMALPVLLLSLFPKWLKRLPRPGTWMETFKQILAFPLYAAVAWLAWVLGAQAGNDAVFALLAGLVLVAMGAWMYGRYEHWHGAWRSAVAIIFAASGIIVAWPGTVHPAQQAARGDEAGWQAWSPEKVRALTETGHAVFVDFTAAWCVTCQVNKRIALGNEQVVREFSARCIVPLKADWTRQDPRITEALSAMGRNAVPVYALYAPGQSEPRLLPEVLTPSLVLDELARLPGCKAAPTRPTTLTQR